MQNNYQKIVNLNLILLLLFLSCRAQSVQNNQRNPLCYNKTFQTQETKCTITFVTCPGNNVDQFISCSVNHCQRHLGTQNCQRSLDFSLDEKSCYKQCCKSDTFNQVQCQSVNAELKQLHQTQDSFIILGTFQLISLALIVISGGLVAFTLIFFVAVIKCNKEPQNQKNDQKNNSLINWSDVKYFDVKCDMCMSYGAVILTPCHHAYHQNCYFKSLQDQNDLIKCVKCPQKMFSVVRIVCGECRQKQYKVKVTKTTILKEIIAEGTIQHAARCQKYNKDVYTDIRLTSTGSSD